MSSLEQKMEIKGSPKQLQALLALGVMFTAASAAIAFGWLPVKSGGLRQAVAWAGLPFFGLVTLDGFRRILKASDTVVTLSAEGVRDIRLAERSIPWGAIKDVGVWSKQGQNVIVLKVPPQTEEAIGLTRMARWTRTANAKLGADGLCIGATGLKIGHKALFAEIVKRVDAVRAGA